MRPTLAFLISPLPAMIMMPIIGFKLRGGDSVTTVVALLLLFVLFLLLQLVIAAPLRWYLATRGWRSVWIDAGLGAMAFAVLAIAYMTLSPDGGGVNIPLLGFVIASALGGVTGLTYGLLRFRDREASMMPTPGELAARFD